MGHLQSLVSIREIAKEVGGTAFANVSNIVEPVRTKRALTVKWIHKVGLAAERDGHLLVARKRGLDTYILPGGKPEGEETDLQTLAREVTEELGCAIEKPFLRGVFKDIAAGASGTVVVVRLYSANIIGEPKPCSEIVELAWIDMKKPGVKLAPSIANGILPYLRRNKNQANSRMKAGSQSLQGIFESI